MSISLELIHQGKEYDCLNILLLGDGFKRKTDFIEYCKHIKNRLFINKPTFTSLQDYINIFACFTASVDEKIPILTTDSPLPATITGMKTFFKTFFYNETPEITNEGKQKISTEILDNITPVVMKKYKGRVQNIERFPDVWRDTNSKSYGAIGIACNNMNDTTTKTFFSGQFITSSTPLCFLFTLAGYKDPDFDISEHVFVHELAHSIGNYFLMADGSLSSQIQRLGDEYVSDPTPQSYPANSEPAIPNLTSTVTFLNSGNKIDTDSLKWRHLMKKTELNALANRGKNAGVYFFSQQQYDALGHLQLVQNKGEDIIQLVEGGLRIYDKGIYHSKLLCTMDAIPVIQGTNNIIMDKISAFCRVCQFHLRRIIKGDWATLELEPSDRDLRTLIQQKKMMERVVAAMKANTPPGKIFESSAPAAALFAILLRQLYTDGFMLERKIRFCRFADHIFIKYNTLIIDPSFFSNYRNPMGVYTCKKNGTGITIPETNSATSGDIYLEKGFVGTLPELQDYMIENRPDAWSSYTHEQIYMLVGNRYIQVPEYKCILPNTLAAADKIFIPPAYGVIPPAAMTAIHQEIIGWNQYVKSTGGNTAKWEAIDLKKPI